MTNEHKELDLDTLDTVSGGHTLSHREIAQMHLRLTDMLHGRESAVGTFLHLIHL